MMSWIFAIPVLGLCTGARTMTPICLLCWYAHLGYLPVQGTWAFWIASPISVGLFTLFAMGEYIGDKLPRTPSRITPFPLASRLAFGALIGAVVAAVLRSSIVGGSVLGIIGAVLGSFGGYHLRRYLTSARYWPDMRVALLEDALALALTFLALGIIAG